MRILAKIVLLIFIILIAGSSLCASISFRSISIEQAQEIAKLEGKFVFVDTYATWCGPCKVMDKVFREPKVGSYFNQNFVNVKIDMDGPYGDEMLHEYEVVWLPTLLIINPEGQVLSKIDRLMTADELIEAATNAKSGYNSAPTSSLNSNPFAKGQQLQNQDYNPEEKEEVIYVYDEKSSSGRPHIMYHEAYLHLQLLDGKHQQVVKKYLSTQRDWSTEKNIKFIFDFLQDVNSAEFDYFSKNRARFNEVLGKERVDKSVGFLISQRLEKGFPRPTLHEAIELMQHVNPALAEQHAYAYYLRRLSAEQDESGYLATARTYLESINPYDHIVLHQVVKLRFQLNDVSSLDQNIEMLHQALALDDQTAEYRYTMARAYFKKKDKPQALAYINQAMALSQSQDPMHEDYSRLLDKINSEL